jgi:uncharacterized iron-regulated membrane protein
MIRKEIGLKIRKAHRYLGLFLGVQFLLWTVSGLYFSWTDIDEIHGDQFKNLEYQPKAFDSLRSPTAMPIAGGLRTIELRDLGNIPHYWMNNSQLINANSGKVRDGITEKEALYVAKNYMREGLEVIAIDLINETGKQHEYRKKLLPAYVISYKSDENIKAYVSLIDGKFQTVRHRDWRWFDFLWMTHTMDYEGRDNFNTIILRAFSLLGLITVFSGFLLWFTTSTTIRGFLEKKTNRNEKI